MWVAPKLDLTKAFDSLELDIIYWSRTSLNFLDSCIKLIMSCITISSTEIKMNGALSPAFKPSRGIRQGDPLSPYLFILAMKILSRSINVKVMSKAWKPIRIRGSSIAFSDLLSADDLILFCEATHETSY